MKNTLAVLLFIFLLSSFASASTAFDVVVKVPWNTPSDDSVSVVGTNIPKTTLHLLNHLTYEGRVEVPDGADHIEFIIVRENALSHSVHQPVDQYGNAPSHFQYQIDNMPKPFVYSVANWDDLPALGVVGRVEKWEQVYSPQLDNHRNISIWLPPEYDANSQSRYPVLYMHDGQNVFDPQTATANLDWRIDDILSEKMKNGELPGMIVVAVDCIGDKRRDEYDYTRTGESYARFLIETVKPAIDQAFRTRSERESTFAMGSSMGAIISLELIWKHPEVFSKAIGLSFPAQANNGSTDQVLRSSPMPKLPVAFYMDHGNYNDDFTYKPYAEKLVQFLTHAGFNKTNFVYDIDPYGDHREVDWSRRVSTPLTWLLKK